ncbi:V-type ATP synthase subunit D [Candidatus Peregrinibacteria bacterium]|jgi:V/A-type H+/Na+-transporting ATPase subunit D|nr:V-type ATP synthase subunit D [Candidatus Peregrinibacteria bacterium]
MALLNINPTRMNLLTLKKQTVTAKRGHKLLKDKRDGLMKHFMQIIREARELRMEIEKEMGATLSSFLAAKASMDPTILRGSLELSDTNIDLEVNTKNIMSVHVPQFKANTRGNFKSYGYTQTTGDLDIALNKLEKVLPLLLKLSELEKTAENLAEEIEKTRRRVNALEYTMIPNYLDTMKFIQMKLGEQERGSIIATMVVKSMIQEKEEQQRQKNKAEALTS